MNPGGGGCSEPSLRHCTPTWQQSKTPSQKKKKRKKRKERMSCDAGATQSLLIKTNIGIGILPFEIAVSQPVAIDFLEMALEISRLSLNCLTMDINSCLPSAV